MPTGRNMNKTFPKFLLQGQFYGHEGDKKTIYICIDKHYWLTSLSLDCYPKRPFVFPKETYLFFPEKPFLPSPFPLS